MNQQVTIEQIEADVANEFNKVLDEFSVKMMKMMKKHKVQLRTMYNSFKLSISTGQTNLPLLMFWDYARPFRHKIESNNIEDAKQFVAAEAGSFQLFEGIDMVVEWERMPDSARNAMVSYFKALFTLASSYHNKGALRALQATRNMMAQNNPQKQMMMTLENMITNADDPEMKKNMEKANLLVKKYKERYGHEPTGADGLKEMIRMARQQRQVEQNVG